MLTFNVLITIQALNVFVQKVKFILNPTQKIIINTWKNALISMNVLQEPIVTSTDCYSTDCNSIDCDSIDCNPTDCSSIETQLICSVVESRVWVDLIGRKETMIVLIILYATIFIVKGMSSSAYHVSMVRGKITKIICHASSVWLLGVLKSRSFT